MTTPNVAASAASPSDTTAPGLSPAAARAALVRLCAASFVAYCSYSICRAPLLPLFARELGAGPSLVGFVMGASTLTGVSPETAGRGAVGSSSEGGPCCCWGRWSSPASPFTYLAVSTLTLAPLRSLPPWQRDGHLQSGRIRKPFRRRTGRASRRVAQHLFHRAGDRPGHRPSPGGVSDRGRAVRSRLRRVRPDRAGRAAYRGHLAGCAGFDIATSILQRVQARRRRGRRRSAGADHQRCSGRAVRPQRHAQRLPPAVWARGPESCRIGARLAVRDADRHDVVGASRDRPAVGSRRASSGHCRRADDLQPRGLRALSGDQPLHGRRRDRNLRGWRGNHDCRDERLHHRHHTARPVRRRARCVRHRLRHWGRAGPDCGGGARGNDRLRAHVPGHGDGRTGHGPRCSPSAAHGISHGGNR